jgi:hypothetical protein
MSYDVFISYSSEDRAALVRPLAQRLRQDGFSVWYDEFELKAGDSLTQKIDYGLSNSKVGIVVLSPSFFRKNWPRRELAGLTARQLHQSTTLIPIWHNVTLEQVVAFSPPLADIKAITSPLKNFKDLRVVIREISRVVTPSGTAPDVRTIEEAHELLERGSFDTAYWIAAKAFDERLHAITVAAGLNDAVGQYVGLVGPAEAIELLTRRGVLRTADAAGDIDLGILRSALAVLHPMFYGSLRPIVGRTQAFALVEHARRFIRANPKPPAARTVANDETTG